MAYQLSDNDALIKYLLGDIPPEERARVEQQLAISGDALQLIDEIQGAQRFANAQGKRELTGEIKQMRKNISAMVEGMNPRDYSVDSHNLGSKLPSNSLSTSAFTKIFRPQWISLALTVAAIVSFWIYSPFYSTDRSVSVYATLNGERARVTLPDGSRVILNVGTTLEVPTDYGRKNRAVTLNGEAVFEVKETSKVPFMVRAGLSVTKVLGTKFVVRHYDTDSVSQISVSSGKVSVNIDKVNRTSARSIVVSANEAVEVSPIGQVARRFKGRNDASFEVGIMLISPKPLSEAIADLNRWYNTDIRLGDSEVGKTIVSGEFPAGSITDFVEQLTTGLKVEVVRNDRVLTLNSSKP